MPAKTYIAHVSNNLEHKERVDLLNKTMCLGGSLRHINENLESKERFDLLKHTVNLINGSICNTTQHIERQENIRIITEALIEVFNKDYADVELPLPEDCVIYCDIPYEKTASYTTGGFDYERFYKWCKEKTSKGYQIYVSSYKLPEDLFVTVWEKQRHSKALTGSKHVVEKIYTIRK